MPIEITFGGEGFQYYQVSNIMMGPAQYTSPECSLPCIQSCIFEKQGVEPVKCPIPCNYGEWSEVQEQTINIYNCPGCQITVRFQRRETALCPQENYSFFDYRLLGWSRNIQACINCLQWEEFYYSYAVNWLLRDGGLPKPNVVDECFTNYRVISNDCWRWHTREDGKRVYTTYCPTDECCYASFTVCYVKDEYGKITMTRYFQNSPAYSMPEQCPQGCSSRNCEKWFPDLVHGREFSEENLIENKDVICNVTAIQDIITDNIKINMECNLNGYVTFELYDLLGNLIINEKFEKNNYYVTYPLKQEINTGMYVIRVKIDDVQVFNNKILIIN